MNIGTKIKELRKSKGFTQIKLSESAGLSQGFISQIEKNSVKVNKSQLMAISKALDIDPVYLVRNSMEVKPTRAVVREIIEGML